MTPTAGDPFDTSTRTTLAFSPGRTVVKREYESPPTWLATAAQAVLNDMLPARSTPPLVRYRRDAELEHFGTVIFVGPDGHHFGFGIPDNAARPALLVALANGIQEYLAESLGEPGRSLPPCPRHTDHPAHAILCNDTAWWACPLHHMTLAPIGQGAL